MSLSLIIRTLNEEENIGRCLRCVAVQTVLPDEVVIVDTNSTDNTLSIVQEFRDILPLTILSNPVPGYVSGLNLGLGHTRQDIVGFLSADCFPQTDWLEKLLDLMRRSDSEVVFGTDNLEGENDVHYVINRTISKHAEDREALYFYNSNILYRRATLNRFLPFRGVGEHQESEDVLLSIEYAKAGLRVMQSGSAIVLHEAYESMDAFKKKVYLHGGVLLLLFQKHPGYPRIYLSSLYWALVECLYFFKFWDVRFLRVGSIHLVYTIRGILNW